MPHRECVKVVENKAGKAVNAFVPNPGIPQVHLSNPVGLGNGIVVKGTSRFTGKLARSRRECFKLDCTRPENPWPFDLKMQGIGRKHDFKPHNALIGIKLAGHANLGPKFSPPDYYVDFRNKARNVPRPIDLEPYPAKKFPTGNEYAS